MTEVKVEPGQVWRNTKTSEQVVVLHVGGANVIVQRGHGVGRVPRPEFLDGKTYVREAQT